MLNKSQDTMKLSKFAVIIALIGLFAACKKSDSIPSGDDKSQYVEGVTRVIAVSGLDSVSSKSVGRVETVSVITFDEDTKMRAELISYEYLGTGKALYTVRAINKTDCQDLVRWHWIGGLLVDSIIPMDDAVYAHDTTVFKVYGNASTGAITLNAEAREPNNCGNSRTLTLYITQAILPIKFTNITKDIVGGKMVIKFSTESPQDAQWFFVMWSPDGKKENEVLKYTIVPDPNVKNYTATWPAAKKGK